MVEEIEESVGKSVVACSFRCNLENFKWAYASVYGPDDDVERRRVGGRSHSVLGGDFKVVWHPCERLGDLRHTQAMVEF